MIAHDRILDAAYDLTCARGWHKVTMSDLAAEAGLSRQSVYNEFGSREGVAAALVHREVVRFMTIVDASLSSGGTLPEAINRTAQAVFTQADGNPLLRAVLTGDDSSLMPLLNSTAVINVAKSHVQQHFPDLDPDVVDVLVRVVVSHVMAPDPDRPDLTATADRLLR